MKDRVTGAMRFGGLYVLGALVIRASFGVAAANWFVFGLCGRNESRLNQRIDRAVGGARVVGSSRRTRRAFQVWITRAIARIPTGG